MSLDNVKSLSIWVLFCIAIEQIVALFFDGFLIFRIWLPAVMFYLYVFYHKKKYSTDITFGNFIISTGIISVIFNFVEYLNLKFIQFLNMDYDQYMMFIFYAFIDVFIASVLFIIVNFIFKRRKA